MQQVRRLRAHWGWLVVVVLLLAGCRGEGGVPLTSTPSEAVRRDAETYAKQFEVTLEQAIERLQFQEGIGDLNAALLANEADTFGGLWIEHEPTYRVVALFARDGKRTLRPYLAGTPYARLVEVRKARYTMAELEAMQAQAIQELDKLDFDVGVSIAVEENRVEVFVSDRAWFESELRRVSAQLPQGVKLVVVEGGSTARDKDLLLTPPVPGVNPGLVSKPSEISADIVPVLKALFWGAMEDRRALVQYISVGCTTADGLGGPPKCPPGVTEGTVVEVFPVGEAEGTFVRPQEIDRTLELLSVEGLYAVYRPVPGVDPVEYWPVGEYALILERRLYNASLPVTVFVQDGKMVRLGFTSYPVEPEQLLSAVPLDRVLMSPDEAKTLTEQVRRPR